MKRKKFREQIEYSGEERMDPRLEKKLQAGQSRFTDNPALKKGALDVQRLYSKSFDDLLQRIRRFTGKETLTPNELHYIVSTKMNSNVGRILELESRHAEELVDLAIEATTDEKEVDPNNFIIKARLGSPSRSTLNKMKADADEVKQELTQEEKEVLRNEVFKRDIINAIIAGVSRKDSYIFEKPEVKAKLDQINSELYPLYKETIPLMDVFYFLNEGMMEMAGEGGGVAAAVEIDDEEGEETGENKTVIKAASFIFPILCHEISKGIEEAMARWGYPEDDEMARMTLGVADTHKSETEALRMGPSIVERIRNLLPMEVLDGSNYGLIRFFLVELYKLPADHFLDLMKYIISTDRNDQEYAEKEFEELLSRAINAKERYEDYLISKFDDEEEEDIDIDDIDLDDLLDEFGINPN